MIMINNVYLLDTPIKAEIKGVAYSDNNIATLIINIQDNSENPRSTYLEVKMSKNDNERDEILSRLFSRDKRGNAADILKAELESAAKGKP